MAGLERQDIISDDALRTIPALTDQLTVLLTTLDQVKTSSKGFSDGLKDAPLPKLKTDTEGLTQAQVELAKVQAQISTVVAKNNDTWIANAQALKNARDGLKNNQATADSWTKSATAQNSSIIQLTDSLNKNRTAYANLRTEAERHSKSGQELLKVIQTQDTSLKSLTASMGQNQSRVGGYREEIEKLIPALRTVAPQAAQAGEAAASFGSRLAALSPVIAVIVAGVAVVSAAVKGYFEHTAEGEEKLEVATAQFTAIWNSSLNSIGEVAGHVLGPIADWFSNMLAKVYVNAAAAKAFAEEQHALALREIDDISVKAKEQKDADALVFQSRDKLTFSDKERLEFAQAALEIRKHISEVDVKLAQDAFSLQKGIFMNEQNGNELTLVQKKKLAEMEAAIYNAEKERFTNTRRIQAEIVTISREIITKQIETEKEHTDATLLNAETILKTEVADNQKILASSKATLDEKLVAQRNYTEDLLKLINVTTSKEIEAARNARDLKLNTSSGDPGQVSAIKQAFVDKETAIVAKGQQEQLALIEKGKQDQAKLIIEDSAYFIALKKRFAEETKTADLQNLEDQYAAGKLTLLKYETQKAEILRGGSNLDISILKQSYKDELDLLQKKLDTDVTLYQADKDKIIAIIISLNKEILKLDEDSNALDRKAKAERIKLAVQLQNQLFATALTAGDNLFQAQQDQLARHIEVLTKDKDQQLKMAGDNANAKLVIEQRYNQAIEIENKKVKKLQHDQAVYDRDVAAVKIAVDIAEAIAKAYGTYPYPVAIGISALLAAIGVAQEIAVWSKPIPAYSGGTGYHGGGPALVAERGSEWVMEPGRAPKLYDVPNTVIPNLAIGSKVLTADETASIERQLVGNMFKDNQRHESGPIIISDNGDVVEAINGIQLPSVLSQGRELIEVWKARDGSRKWINSKIFWNE